MVSFANPSLPFIFLPLGFMPKHNRGFWQIYYRSHSKRYSVNDHILDRVGKLRYTRFQELPNLILPMGHHSIIIKRVIRNPFQNVLIAPQEQCLLGFM